MTSTCYRAQGFVALCSCLCLFLGLSSAQNSATGSGGEQLKPNLSGTWMLDQTLTRRANSKQRVPGSRKTALVILDRNSEIRITTKTISGGHERTREFLFYGDGRGEINPGPPFSLALNDVSNQTKSRTEWNKNKLTINNRVRRVLLGSFYHVEVFDEWKLSPDGQILTQTTSVHSDSVDVGARVGSASVPIVIIPSGREIKNVYRRVAD